MLRQVKRVCPGDGGGTGDKLVKVVSDVLIKDLVFILIMAQNIAI